MADSPVSLHEVPFSEPVSQMRTFLESGQDWKWPSELGQCSGNHCKLYSTEKLPFKWKEKISQKKATIDAHEIDPASKINFQGAFVVKTPRESGSMKARQVTTNEVNTMKDLRYPHVTALLGSFEFQNTLSILIFPAARCDLRRFMKHLSVDTLQLREHPTLSNLRRLSVDTSASDDNPRPISSIFPSKSNISQGPKMNDNITSPLGLSCGQRFRMLRRFFVCLSQALCYLHESGVRHKDIKPENILIDESYNVLLTDFGISRKFEKHAPHTTNNEWNFTRKYASPEMMAGKQSFRGDPSDVFSLGCVFLEMATLLLSKSLKDLTDHYTTQINASPKNEDAYFCNMENVYDWILLLPTATPPMPFVLDIEEQIYEENDIQKFRARFTQPLQSIREMLDLDPGKRPKSKDLWKRFMNISLEWCKDCDPRHGEKVWKPSDQQMENSQSGRAKRRSMREEEINDASKQSAVDQQYLSVKLAQDSRSPRALSPVAGRKQSSLGDDGIHSRPSSPPHNTANSPSMSRLARMRVVDNSSLYSSMGSGSFTSFPMSPLYERGSEVPRRESSILETRNSPSAPEEDSPQPMASTTQRSESHLPPSSQHTHGQPVPVEPQAVQALRPQERPHSLGMWSRKRSRGSSILIYDLQEKVPYKAPSITLRGRKVIEYDLPRSDRHVNIGDKARLTAKVDLGSLSLLTKVGRLVGFYSKLHVVNFEQASQDGS